MNGPTVPRSTAERLLTDLAAIRDSVKKIEAGLPPCEDWQTTITADQLQWLGFVRVICDIALEDHPDIARRVLVKAVDRVY